MFSVIAINLDVREDEVIQYDELISLTETKTKARRQVLDGNIKIVVLDENPTRSVGVGGDLSAIKKGRIH